MVSASHTPLHRTHWRFSYPTPPTTSFAAHGSHTLDYGSQASTRGSHALAALPVIGVAIFFWAFCYLFAFVFCFFVFFLFFFFYVTWVIVSL
jgi:hypothetical protein